MNNDYIQRKYMIMIKRLQVIISMIKQLDSSWIPSPKNNM